jgi:hypothetical protein
MCLTVRFRNLKANLYGKDTSISADDVPVALNGITGDDWLDDTYCGAVLEDWDSDSPADLQAALSDHLGSINLDAPILHSFPSGNTNVVLKTDDLFGEDLRNDRTHEAQIERRDDMDWD